MYILLECVVPVIQSLLQVKYDVKIFADSSLYPKYDSSLLIYRVSVQYHSSPQTAWYHLACNMWWGPEPIPQKFYELIVQIEWKYILL